MLGAKLRRTGTSITGHGVWHPDNVLTNEELCVAFNEFVRREIAGEPALAESGGVRTLGLQQVGEEKSFTLGESRHAVSLRPPDGSAQWTRRRACPWSAAQWQP